MFCISTIYGDEKMKKIIVENEAYRKYTLKSSVLGLAQIMIRPAGKMFTDKDLVLL